MSDKKLRNSPSGPQAAQMVDATFDWGIIAPGENATFVSLAAVVPDEWATFITSLGPFPVNGFGFALQANAEGTNAGIIFAFDNDVNPLPVNTVGYEITSFDPNRMHP